MSLGEQVPLTAIIPTSCLVDVMVASVWLGVVVVALYHVGGLACTSTVAGTHLLP